MTRFAILCAAGLLLVLLALPAAAIAQGPWAVKDATGNKIGVVRTISASKGRITTASGEPAEANPTRRGRWTAWGYVRGGDFGFDAVIVEHAALWHGTPRWRLVGFGESGPQPVIGRVVHRGGRWLVQSCPVGGSGWSDRGWVSDACPPWLAGGAVYLCLIPRGQEW